MPGRLISPRISAYVAAAVLFAGVAHEPVARAQIKVEANSAAVSPSARLGVEPDLDAGFHLLYELKFAQARERFTGWERQHPGDPLGPALEAAGYLFEQFYRKGVLTSEFFLDDKRLLGGIEGQPDAGLESSFLAAAQRSEDQARLRLAGHPDDPDALFALTLAAGMRADNSSLIEKRQLESMQHLRESDQNAKALLAVAPSTFDAYLALGAANYIVGCLPGYKRAFLWFGGVHGNKELGMRQLSLAASSGHYLQPYAKLLLALAALREKNSRLARVELTELTGQFPDNPLFARELEKLGSPTDRAAPAAP